MSEVEKWIADSAMNACLMEVLSPKPGNVYPGAEWNFHDLKVIDFIRSSRSIRSAFSNISNYRFGELILNTIIETRKVTSTNTNLGQVLLLAPLAYTFLNYGAISVELIAEFISQLTVKDSRDVYQAIRLAKPGGMGDVNSEDLGDDPTLPLNQIMQLASSYDSVAKQYANHFQDVLGLGLNSILIESNASDDWRDMIVSSHLHFMADLPDTLIARKCGWKVAEDSAKMAKSVIQRPTRSAEYLEELKSLDQWLRVEGNQRNPGTTADLVTATIFVALIQKMINVPEELESMVNLQIKVAGANENG